MNPGRIALNVADLTRYGDDVAVSLMIAPVIQSRQIVNVNPRVLDEGAVILECPNERAQAIVTWIRRALDIKHKVTYPCRAYQEGAGGGWSKLISPLN